MRLLNRLIVFKGDLMSEYFEQSIALIENSQLIANDDLQAITNINEELTHNFKTGQIFRSQWEMENSVLNDVKFPTPDSKYWQAVREQQGHFQELTMLSYEYRMNTEKVNLLKATLDEQLEKLKDSNNHSPTYRKGKAKANILRIKVEKLRYLMLNQQRTAKDRIREVLSWHEIMEKLKPQMLHGTDSYEKHQAQSYKLRFQQEMQIAQGSFQSPSEARNLTALHNMSQKITNGRVLSRR